MRSFIVNVFYHEPALWQCHVNAESEREAESKGKEMFTLIRPHATITAITIPPDVQEA